MRDCVKPLVERWIADKKTGAKPSVVDVLEAIHQESIWRQRWFATALIAGQSQCCGEQIANVFKDVADATKDLESFRKAAFWKQKHRTMAGPSFMQAGNSTPLWCAIQKGSKSPLSDKDRQGVEDAAKDI